HLAEEVAANLPNISRAEIEKISGGLYLLYESAITESHLFGNDWPIYTAKGIAPSLFPEKGPESLMSFDSIWVTLKVFTIPLDLMGMAARLTNKSPTCKKPLSQAFRFTSSMVWSVETNLSF